MKIKHLLIVFGSFLAMLYSSVACGQQSHDQRPPETNLGDSASLRGEIAIYNNQGRVIRLVRGLGSVSSLSVSADGRLLVADSGRRKLFSLDPKADYKLTRSWTAPFDELVAAHVLPSGNLLVASASAGLAEIDRENRVVWSSPSNHTLVVTSVAPLPNGSIVVVGRNESDRMQSHFTARGPDHRLQPIAFREEPGLRNIPKVIRADATSSQVIFWDDTWAAAYSGIVDEDSFVVTSVFEVDKAWFVDPDGKGGFVSLYEPNRVSHVRNGEQLAEFRTNYLPQSFAYLEDHRAYAVGYYRDPGNSWPAIHDDLPVYETVSWPMVLGSVLVGLLMGALWIFPVVRRQSSRAASEHAPEMSAEVSAKSRTPHLSPLYTSIIPLVGIVTGLALAVWGQLRLDTEFSHEAVGLYALGAVMVAAFVELRRRFVMHQRNSFFSVVGKSRPRLLRQYRS